MVDLVRTRLRNQGLLGARFATPEDAVRALGAVQAQEYVDSKWALAMRTRTASDAAIERALDEGRILRTHVLRPTWHFVTAADIRWMLALTGPRVSRAMASYNRKLGLDAALFRRSERAIVRALRGGVQLTRRELKTVLQRAGIETSGLQRLSHIVGQAELDAVICSGARRDTQLTYALLDERVAPSRTRSREEALAELARRYFTGHGPAQLHDFAWWSGLSVGDARAGIEAVERELARDVIDGRTYWCASSTPAPARHCAHLLGPYDEFLIAYKDRSAALDASRWTRLTAHNRFIAPVLISGRVVGGWKRSLKKSAMTITVTTFSSMEKRDTSAVAAAARAYAAFCECELELSWRRK